jgi:hypothetical protein
VFETTTKTLGEPLARAHRRRHDLPPCTGRRLEPGPGAGAERRHPGQRAASRTRAAGAARGTSHR